jgi:hypothetical protein
MNINGSGSPTSDLCRVRLHLGRWYALTLTDGRVVIVTALSGRPGVDEWQLIGGWETCTDGDYPAHLVARPDGTLEPDSGVDLVESAAGQGVIEDGLTVLALVPADAIAQAFWIAAVGPYVVCARCGGSSPSSRRALPHRRRSAPLCERQRRAVA